MKRVEQDLIGVPLRFAASQASHGEPGCRHVGDSLVVRKTPPSHGELDIPGMPGTLPLLPDFPSHRLLKRHGKEPTSNTLHLKNFQAFIPCR